MNDPHLKYKIAISLIPGIGSILAKKLVEYAGGAKEVFKIPREILCSIPGIGKRLSEEISKGNILETAEKEIEFIIKYNIRPLFFFDGEYPRRLKHCQDSPVIIFAKGNADPDHKKIISIVGTRSATVNGKETCGKLIRELAERGHNPVIVSGLAYGIDICAHKEAMDHGLQTIAVLAHGLSTIYPSVHSAVARNILSQGALFSEFLSWEKPKKNNFIKRNRIIAGMADATIVVESGEKGGALITADIANSYDRDVFAVPGRITDRYSAGCNKLIKTHKAALIETAADLEYFMGWEKETNNKATGQARLFYTPTKEEQIIISLFQKSSEASVDKICRETGFPISKISNILLNLEFEGLLKSLPGKIYKLSY